MPRKTKEQKELELKNEDKKVKTTNKKKTSTKKTSTTKNEINTPTNRSTSKKTSSSATTKKSNTKKGYTASKKTTSKKSTTGSKTKKGSKITKTSKKTKVEVVEYYDLPYRYNQTVVKVLAQTPTNLFIYWDISDKDRKNFEKKYGNDFFEKTRPVLIVYNDTIGYSFEVEINDFANSWYLNVADSKCDYRIELGRRPIENVSQIPDNYIYISTSNEIELPNNRILFDENQKMVYFRNVKTGEQHSKPITSMSFIRNMGKIYNIYDVYKAIYDNENVDEIYNLSNPSSGNPSSRKFFFKILRTFGISPKVLFIIV